MKRVALWGACALCVVAATTAWAQQYDDSAFDRDYDSSYDRDSGQSYRSGGQSRTDMYSDRERDQDWYGQRDRSDRWRSEYGDQSQYRDRYGDRSQFRDQYDSGARYRSGRGYEGDQYGYRGDSEYQDWRMDREGRMDREFMGGREQARRGIAAIGRVIREDATLSGVNPNHKLVQIQTRQGTRLYVDLGPSEQAQGLDVSPDASIFVHGRLTTIGGQQVLMARQLGKVSQLTTIQRGEEAFSTGQRSRDIYGYQDETGAKKDQSGKPGESEKFKSKSQSHQWDSSQSGQSGQSGQWGQSGQSSQSGQSGQSSGSSGQ